MKYLYKYPQAEYPYAAARRGEPAADAGGPGVRAARHGHLRREPLLRRLRRVREGHARGHRSSRSPSPTAARRRPRSTCCRRSGSATPGRGGRTASARPRGGGRERRRTARRRRSTRPYLGRRYLHVDAGRRAALHRERDQRRAALRRRRTPSPYVKDAFHDYVDRRRRGGRQPGAARDQGRRAPPPDRRRAGGSARVRLASDRRARGTTAIPSARSSTGRSPLRQAEADEFYAAVIPERLSPEREERDAAGVRRDALVEAVLQVRRPALARRRPAPASAAARARRKGRNSDWRHVFNADVLSMPDTWEFPWYAAWDLAFHCVVLALVDAGSSPRTSSS